MSCHTQVSQCNTGGKPKRCVRAAPTGNRRFGVSASTTAVFGGGGTLREAKHPQMQMVGYQLNDARDDKTTPLFPSKRFQKSSVFFLGCEKGGPPCSIAGKLQVLQGVESKRNCEPWRRQLQRSQRFP